MRPIYLQEVVVFGLEVANLQFTPHDQCGCRRLHTSYTDCTGVASLLGANGVHACEIHPNQPISSLPGKRRIAQPNKITIVPNIRQCGLDGFFIQRIQQDTLNRLLVQNTELVQDFVYEQLPFAKVRPQVGTCYFQADANLYGALANLLLQQGELT